MSTLMASGVPILQALETVAGAVDNEVLSGAVLDARTAVREGERLGEPLERSKTLPADGGADDQHRRGNRLAGSMLAKVADFYEAEVDAMLESLTAALEPLLIVFLGGVVGFIVVAMFLPLVAIIEKLSASLSTRGLLKVGTCLASTVAKAMVDRPIFRRRCVHQIYWFTASKVIYPVYAPATKSRHDPHTHFFSSPL